MTKFTLIFGASLLVSLALTTVSCHAETQQKSSQSQVVPVAVASAPSSPKHSLLGQKLASVGQPKARSARSLSDMFERVKSRIFGSKKQSSGSAGSASSASNQVTSSAAASSPVQSSLTSSSQAAQRQPWDLNAFNQQFNPYASLSNGLYQWPSGSSVSNQFMSPQFLGAQPAGMISGLDAISASASSQAAPSAAFNANGIAQQSAGGANQANGQAGGLLSSASHLIAQYLSPAGSGSNSGPQQQQQFNQQQQPQVAGASLTPQQQQQQSTYQDFANILDGLVAQTTGSTGSASGSNNKFMMPQHQQQQQPGQSMQQSGASYPPSSVSGAIGGGQPGDADMAGSSNIQSYLPSASGAGAATPQQASQKSSMVGLAEQLAPGAQFNKLISFPFSLSSNDDQSKEGRYKLHIPFLNQHVKRSDEQAAQQQRAKSQQQLLQQQQQQQQQQWQQYLSSLYQQQQQPQQYASQYGQSAAQSQQQSQLVAQPSQVVPTIVSPQAAPSAVAAPNSPVSSSQSISTSVSSSSSSSSAISQSQPSASASVSSSNQSPSSSSSSSASSSPSSSASASNQRPSWSVSDTQSSASASSNKLIPMQSASVAAALDSSDESVAQS